MKARLRSVAWGKVLPLAALLVLTLIAAAPLWGPGLLNTRGGGDSPFLLLRTHQMAVNLRAGVFPVRWMPDAAYGLGYPFFSYYAALPYYLSAALTLVALDVLSAIKLTQTFFLAAAGLGTYGWARRVLGNRTAGWLAATAYTLAPYHLVNVYVRGDSLSEFAAFAFYPLILWGLERLAGSEQRCPLRSSSWMWPAIAYAGLILTHNVSALIFTPFTLLYLLLLAWRDGSHRKRILLQGGLALGLGILLSAWFWVPALGEIGDVQLTSQTSGYFFYGGHFRGSNLIQSTVIFDYDISPDRSSPFAMGLVQAVLVLLGLVLVIIRWACLIAKEEARFLQTTGLLRSFAGRHDSRILFGLLGLLLSTGLITPLSRAVWDRVPLLPMVQFPWRFLSVQALFGALFIGAIVLPLRRQQWVFAAVVAGLLTISSLMGLQPDYLPITADEVVAQRLQLYELFTGNIGSTIRYEYLPRWAKPRPHTGPALFDPEAPPQPIPLDGTLAAAEKLVHQPTHRRWRVDVGADDAKLAFPLHYWPGWRATVDGQPVPTTPALDSGYLTLHVPPGAHQVDIQLGRTWLRLGAEIVSLAALLLTIGVIIRSVTIQTQTRSSEPQHGPAGARSLLPHIICLAVFVALLVLLVAFAPRVSPSHDADLTMDFEQRPYLHHNPDGIEIGGVTMTGYRYNTRQLSPGRALEVTLEGLATPSKAVVSVALVSPAAVRHAGHPPVAESTVEWLPTSEAGSPTVMLPISERTAPGLYLVRLAERSERSPVYLRPVWIQGAGANPPSPAADTFADGALRLHGVDVTQPRSTVLDVALEWSVTRRVAANYGLSLQLTDPAGNEWARLETQPGRGFMPTSLWPTKCFFTDPYRLSLPKGTPPGDAYTLTVSLYRVATLENVGQATMPVALEQVTRRPEAPIITELTDDLALSEIEVPERVKQGEDLNFTIGWLTSKQPEEDYIAEWELEARGGTNAATSSISGPLAAGSRPSTWPAHAWVAGRFRFPIPPTMPPGDYTLTLTLRDPTSDAPLTTYTYSALVTVRGRERVWELPPMEQAMGARFGEMLELAGYDLRRERATLYLTLYWRALAVPDRHYMYFVHLAEPSTGRPVAQLDTMPRGFRYPTGLWVEGEVVVDEAMLSLDGVSPGRYEMVVGWYDPDTGQRLVAVDDAGAPQPDNRLILPDAIVLSE